MSDARDGNAEQIAFWNGPGGASWVAGQVRMDATLAPVADAVIAHAEVRTGERVLDIGCGCGATALALADAVGPEGRVTGLDVSAPMLGLARTRAAGRANVDWVLEDATTHGFAPASADLLFSRFGVMFFDDPVAAFANLRTALAPGGRVAFACWRPFDQNPWMQLPLRAVTTVVPPLPRPGPDEPGPFAFGDTARVTRILTAAGFAPPRFEPFDFHMTLGDGSGLEAAVEQGITMGPAARALQDQPDNVRANAKVALSAALGPFLEAGTVRLPAAVWLVSTK